MDTGEIDWAGTRFIAVSHHDARFFKAPGLYGYARRAWNGERVLLYLGHAEVIALDACPGAPMWNEALALGMNELHINLRAAERLDRLQLADRIVRRAGPILNLVGQEDKGPTLRQAEAV